MVPFGEVGVHGGNVDAFAVEGEQAGRHGGDEGLAFTRGHFGDGGFDQGDGRAQLAGKSLEARGPGGNFSHAGEGLGDHGIETEVLPRQSESPAGPFLGQGGIREPGHGLLQAQCPRDNLFRSGTGKQEGNQVQGCGGKGLEMVLQPYHDFAAGKAISCSW